MALARAAHQPLTFAQRLIAATAYLVALIVLAYWAHRGWPPASTAGLWFYSASLALLLSVFIAEPFYTSPRVALANGAALVLIALTAGAHGLAASDSAVRAGRIALITLGSLIFGLSVVAVLTTRRPGRVNTLSFELSRTLGSGYLLYGIVFVMSVYASFANEPKRLAVLLAAALAFTWGPVERMISLLHQRPRGRTQDTLVVAVEDPGTVIATAPSGVSVSIGDKLLAGDAEGVVVDVTQSAVEQQVRAFFPPETKLASGTRLERALSSEAGEGDTVVGYAAAGTSMNVLRVAASAAITSTGIEEGRLLAAPIRSQDVLYQVTEAELREDTVASGVHARFEIRAQKLGVWHEAQRSFELVPWVPDPGVPVQLKSSAETDFDPAGIGTVPGTSFSIRYFPTRAVTHNTAILGILGSGKTTLARELICRNVCDGIQVIILDITNQYANFFGGLATQEDVDEAGARINEAIRARLERLDQDEDRLSYGNRGEFFRQMKAEFEGFLQSADPLRIYNPMAFRVSTIEGYPRNRAAELLREATTVEKTSLIASALLAAASGLGETEEGRVCLVLEEAHTLVPEPTEGLTREDQRAVHSTARAVLQGRKYGYGCLLISQRTANVTKTILNQCHTVFALRSYDATGIGFLANYLGDAYSRLLSGLPQFHCAAFGGGISCQAPVIMRLNDPIAFTQQYWQPELERIERERA